MKFKDMDQVEAWQGGAILAAGPHVVRITSVTEGTSSGGHPQIELDYEAIDGSGSIREWLVVVPKTYGKVKSLLEAAGIEVQGGDWDFDPSVLNGKTLTVVVGVEPRRDDPSRTRSVVNAHAPASDKAGSSSNGGGSTGPDDDVNVPF